MKTPTLQLASQQIHRLEYHNPEGKKCSLEAVGDGAIEKQVWDGLSSLPQGERFVRSLDDERVVQGKMGPGWSYLGDTLYAGKEQQIRFAETPAGREVTLTTHFEGVEHQLRGLVREGKVQPESVREQLQLEVSAAGIDVYSNGKVLFEMPSAFTGGCTW